MLLLMPVGWAEHPLAQHPGAGAVCSGPLLSPPGCSPPRAVRAALRRGEGTLAGSLSLQNVCASRGRSDLALNVLRKCCNRKKILRGGATHIGVLTDQEDGARPLRSCLSRRRLPHCQSLGRQGGGAVDDGRKIEVPCLGTGLVLEKEKCGVGCKGEERVRACGF